MSNSTETNDMKITITKDEIASREHLMFVGKKRMTEMSNLVNRHEPIMLTAPVYCNEKVYGLIVPDALLPTDTAKYRLTFYPLAARCYRVCHIRSTKIKALICEFDGKQWQFDEFGAHPSSFTLNGNGVDPELTAGVDYDLAYALSGHPENPACKSVVTFIRERSVLDGWVQRGASSFQKVKSVMQGG